MRALAIAGIAAVLCACAPAPGATPEAASVATGANAPAGQFEFAFMAKDPAREDARITGWLDDPCGEAAVARVATMPLDDPQLQPDLVIEFDAAGREVQRWGKPFGAEILGLSGNRLVFGDSVAARGRAWWTDATGAIGEAMPPPGGLGATLQAVDCPAVAGPATLQCHQITDQAGLRRRLAWEGACS